MRAAEQAARTLASSVRPSHSGISHPRLTPVTLPGTVSTHAGCCDKMPLTRRLINNGNGPLTALSGGKSKIKGPPIRRLGGPPPGARDGCPLRYSRGRRELRWVSFIREIV